MSCEDVQILSDKEIPNTIRILINQDRTDSILVDSIGKFDWDELYILKPYLSKIQYQQLKSKIDNLPSSGPATFEDEKTNYLVFTKNGIAIKFSEITRYPCCDFDEVGKGLNPALIRKGTYLYVRKYQDGRISLYK